MLCTPSPMLLSESTPLSTLHASSHILPMIELKRRQLDHRILNRLHRDDATHSNASKSTNPLPKQQEMTKEQFSHDLHTFVPFTTECIPRGIQCTLRYHTHSINTETTNLRITALSLTISAEYQTRSSTHDPANDSYHFSLP